MSRSKESGSVSHGKASQILTKGKKILGK